VAQGIVEHWKEKALGLSAAGPCGNDQAVTKLCNTETVDLVCVQAAVKTEATGRKSRQPRIEERRLSSAEKLPYSLGLFVGRDRTQQWFSGEYIFPLKLAPKLAPQLDLGVRNEVCRKQVPPEGGAKRFLKVTNIDVGHFTSRVGSGQAPLRWLDQSACSTASTSIGQDKATSRVFGHNCRLMVYCGYRVRARWR